MNVPILELRPTYLELKDELDAAYRRVMESGWYLLGPELEAFEQEYARYVGVRHCVGVANGLEALQLVLMAWGIGPGDEVIVPAHGYIATWLAVTHTGAKPVPCECEGATYALDPERVEASVTERTKALLPIHLYGQTADMAALRTVAARHRLKILEDAAQAHGATHQGRKAGALGDAAGWSFYPSKNLGAFSDGGAITTDDDAVAERLRALRNYGSKIRYQNDHLGLNSRLEELQAAVLRVKLRKLDEWNARRVRQAGTYRAALAGVGDLVLPRVGAGREHVWHLFVVRTRRRAELQTFLKAQGIGTQVHYPIPPHLSGAYASAGWRRGSLPETETWADEVLSLPIGPHLSDTQVEFVIEQVRAFFGG